MHEHDKEKGYTRIINPILEAMSAGGFTAIELRVLIFLIREIYGFNVHGGKLLSHCQISKGIQTDRARTSKAISKLRKKSVIFTCAEGKKSKFKINKDVTKWQLENGDETPHVTKRHQNNGDEKPPSLWRKATITGDEKSPPSFKETIKENIKERGNNNFFNDVSQIPLPADKKTSRRKTTRKPASNTRVMRKESLKFKPEGMADKDWLDLFDHRRKKRAAETPRALKGLAKELQRAHQDGWPYEIIVDKITQRGWIGFDASWTKNWSGKPYKPELAW